MKKPFWKHFKPWNRPNNVKLLQNQQEFNKTLNFLKLNITKSNFLMALTTNMLHKETLQNSTLKSYKKSITLFNKDIQNTYVRDKQDMQQNSGERNLNKKNLQKQSQEISLNFFQISKKDVNNFKKDHYKEKNLLKRHFHEKNLILHQLEHPHWHKLKHTHQETFQDLLVHPRQAFTLHPMLITLLMLTKMTSARCLASTKKKRTITQI